jgi:hypothetical protein
MKIADRQIYFVDPDELERMKERGMSSTTRPNRQDCIDIHDGDGELFGSVRLDMLDELLALLNKE